jgi:glucose-6-phosphate 1-dehydrogenase
MPQPCTVIIFGATGDLTKRKLIPALYNLAADGDLPSSLTVVGFARREKTDEEFRTEMGDDTRKFSRQSVQEELWHSFGNRIFYHRSEFGDPEGYKSLAKRLEEIDAQFGTRGNRLFYLSVAPSEFEGILKNLKDSGLSKSPSGGWARVIVEKPFGYDLATACELNSVVANTFAESDTFRIDHFLGK